MERQVRENCEWGRWIRGQVKDRREKEQIKETGEKGDRYRETGNKPVSVPRPGTLVLMGTRVKRSRGKGKG